MKKNCFISILLIVFILITTSLFFSCNNLFSSLNKKSEITAPASITLALPYGTINNGPRAADTTVSYEFSILFEHEDGTDTPFKGNSGDTITFENAPIGKYKVVAKGVSNATGGTYEGEAETEVLEGQTSSIAIKLKRTDKVEINIISFTEEVPDMIRAYIKAHPDCGIVLNKPKIFATNDANYSNYLLKSLKNGDDFDLYTAEANCVLRATQGDLSAYSLPYNKLIPNVDEKIKAAEYDSYVVQIGSNKSNEVLGLSYQLPGGAFIYRRSVAKKVYGTDDPETIKAKIGGGTNKWDTFWQAAADCKGKGVSIVSGTEDLWRPIESSATTPWIKDNTLNIDEKRAEYLDFAKKLVDNGYSNNTTQWTEDWYKDIAGKGTNPVLGFFGPAWLINYAIVPNCDAGDNDWAVCTPPVPFYWGGTWIMANKNLEKASLAKQKTIGKILEWLLLDTSENGMLYQWANGLLDNVKDTVPSKVVSSKSNGSIATLGGQNMYEYFVPATGNRSNNMTEYDEVISSSYMRIIREYARGAITKDEAINSFKMSVYYLTGVKSNFEAGAFVSEHMKTEPDENGIKITLHKNDTKENWKEWSGAFIFEETSGIYIKLDDNVPTAESDAVFYFPFTKNKGIYSFKLCGDIGLGKDLEEKIIGVATGGLGEMNLHYEHFDASLTGRKLKLPSNYTYTINETIPEGVRVYYDYSVWASTSTEKGPNPWDFDWGPWVDSGELEFTTAMANTLKSEGYEVIKADQERIHKLESAGHYVASFTIDYKVDINGRTYKFEASHNSYTDLVAYNLDSLEANKSPHMTAEAVDGGIKITIRKLDGENNWTKNNAVRSMVYLDDKYDGEHRKEGLTAEFDQNWWDENSSNNYVLTDDHSSISFIYPFTKANELYEFELSGKFDKQDGEDGWFGETVVCTANSGRGELIDAAYWQKDVNVSFDTNGNTYTINCDFTRLIKVVETSLGNTFESLIFKKDVYPYANYEAKAAAESSQGGGYIGPVESISNPISIVSETGAVFPSETALMNLNLLNGDGTPLATCYISTTLENIRLKDDNVKYHLQWKDISRPQQ